MKCDIFIRSYDKDSEWLKYCIKSIKKYARGFNDIIITYPENHISCKQLGCKNFEVQQYCNDGYVDQQLNKLLANKYCSNDTTHILFVDSDCCFYDYFSPENYSLNEKSILYYSDYKIFENHESGALVWKKITESILNISIQYEFMRRQPLIYSKYSLIELQNWISQNKYINIIDFFKQIQNRQISEFNLLGAFIFYIKQDTNYIYRDAQKEIVTYNPCKQYWSWGGFNENIIKELQLFTND